MRRTHRAVTYTLIIAAAVLVSVVLLYGGYRLYLRVAYPLKYEEYVTQYAAENDLPPSLVYAVIHTESHFQEDATSHAGAKGLMQLMDATYEWVQTRMEGEPQPLERIYEPELNIRCGCKVLQIVLKQFDNTETALAAYNAGSGNVSQWLKNPEYSDDGVTLKVIPITETKNYVRRVLKAQEMYQTMYEIDGEES